MINGKHGQGIHCTKLGADSLAKNTLNAPEFICPICLPNPKVLDFNEKRFHWASVVRDSIIPLLIETFCKRKKKLFNADWMQKWRGEKVTNYAQCMYWYRKFLTKFRIQFPVCLLYIFFVKKISGGKLGVCTHKNMRWHSKLIHSLI